MFFCFLRTVSISDAQKTRAAASRSRSGAPDRIPGFRCTSGRTALRRARQQRKSQGVFPEAVGVKISFHRHECEDGEGQLSGNTSASPARAGGSAQEMIHQHQHHGENVKCRGAEGKTAGGGVDRLLVDIRVMCSAFIIYRRADSRNAAAINFCEYPFLGKGGHGAQTEKRPADRCGRARSRFPAQLCSHAGNG